MLLELQIRNFLIIEALDLNFERGMTVITGETGAGKSILLDALQFVAGGRGDAKLIRTGKTVAEVSAQFKMAAHHPAHALLEEWSINAEEDACILRRVLNEEGRSKAYINGQLVSITQLKSLAESLLNWVGQYEHQVLLRAEAQLQTLDDFAKAAPVLALVAQAAKNVHAKEVELEALRDKAHKNQETHGFKAYQLEVLDQLGMQENEWDTLHEEQKKLASGSQLRVTISAILSTLREEEPSLIAQVKRLEKESAQLAASFSTLQNPAQLCADAAVNLEEAYHELKAFYDSLELDPERLQEIEARLSEIHAAARKLQVQVESLFDYHQALAEEMNAVSSLDEHILAAQNLLEQERKAYQTEAGKLTAIRQQAATKLAAHVTPEMKSLGMKEAQFRIALNTDTTRFTAKGQDAVEFQVRMNPGQKWSSLKAGASGGELSRIALVVAVLNAKQNAAETLIFDEVDVGVSGAVAEKVGQLLQKLGAESQVLCITHLPQVALLGHQHIHVSKAFKDGHTFGSAKALDFEERVDEVARIMSGEAITEHARTLARESLEWNRR